MNAPAGGTKQPTLDRVDDELVRKHIESSEYATYTIWIWKKRATSGGADAITKTWTAEPKELIDGRLDERIFNEWGGGEYVIDVRAPATLEPIQKYRFTRPGMPKQPGTAVPAGYTQQTAAFGFQGAIPSGGPMYGIPGLNIPPAAYAVPGMVPQVLSNNTLSPPPPDLVPTFARGLPLVEQWNAVYAEATRSGRLPAGASIHSDALASQHAQAWEARERLAAAETKELRDRLEKMERDRAEDAKRVERERAADERRALEERHKADMRLLEAKIEAQNAAPKGPSMIELATALVPLGIAWLQSNAKRDADLAAAQQQSQLALAQASRESTNLIISTIANKPQSNGLEDIVKLVVPLLPVITKWMDADSPSKRAEVLQMMNTNMLMNLKMVSDMINMQAESLPETPSWLPAAQGIIGALLEGFKNMGGMKALTTPAPAPRSLPADNGAPTQVPADEEGVWRHLEAQDAEAAAKTRQAWALIPQDAGFHTPEWRILIFNFYMKLLPGEIAPLIADYVEHLFKFGMLPPAFVGPDPKKPLIVTHPRETLGQILNALRHEPEYTGAVIEACVKEFEERAAEEEDEPAEATVTPAPAEVGTLRGATVEIES